MMSMGILKKVFIAVFALTVLFQFDLIIALFNSGWDTNTLFFLIPLLTLLIGCILLLLLLLKSNKVGLVLLAIYSTYAGVALFAAGVLRLIIFVASEELTNSQVTYMIFPTFTPGIQVLVGAIFLFLAWMVSRAKLLDDSGTFKSIVYRATGATTVVALLLTFK